MDYCLITAARDEATKIGRTIESVRRQTRLPTRWLIVSDGSTDGTNEILLAAAEEIPFLEVLILEPGRKRDFASKAFALGEGLLRLGEIREAAFGVLDADIVLEPDHFERMAAALRAEPTLGLAGPQLWEEFDGRRVRHDNSVDSVVGGAQFFRREAFAAVGHFEPLARGGEDSLVEFQVRAGGWGTRTLREIHATHQGRIVSGGRSPLGLRYLRGWNCWVLGYSPAFFLTTVLYRLARPPYVLGGLAQLVGWSHAVLTRTPQAVDARVKAHVRAEQRSKLRRMLRLRGGVR